MHCANQIWHAGAHRPRRKGGHRPAYLLAVWILLLTLGCDAVPGAVSSGLLSAQGEPADDHQKLERATSGARDISFAGLTPAADGIVSFLEADEASAALGRSVLELEAGACRQAGGAWSPLWLSCRCPGENLFVAGRGCEAAPALRSQTAGCEGEIRLLPTPCLHHLEAGPVAFDLHFRFARGCLASLRNAPRARSPWALFGGALTLPDTRVSAVRLHLTHRLRENVAGLAVWDDASLRVDFPNYVFVAPDLNVMPASKKARCPEESLACRRALTQVTGLGSAAVEQLCRDYLVAKRALGAQPQKIAEGCDVAYRPAAQAMRVCCMLAAPKAIVLGNGDGLSSSAELMIFLRDQVPLARVLHVYVRPPDHPFGSLHLRSYLSPDGDLLAWAFSYVTDGSPALWHLFDRMGRALSKKPCRILRSAVQTALQPEPWMPGCLDETVEWAPLDEDP